MSDDTHSQKLGRLHKGYFRNGENHRGGADVTFADIVKIFGFRSAEIGKWVTKTEQQIAANLFFDALCDLSDILKVPNEVISLKGSLSISFGKGGKKHSQAHYNSAKRQLALAKNAGGGALAHEWSHSFDHFITCRFLKSANPQDFASELWLKNAEVVAHPINHCLEACFQSMFLRHESDEPSTLFSHSAAADRSLKAYYYSRPQEVFARAFEAFVQDQSIKNAFLVQGTKKSKEANLGIYPQGFERESINANFKRYFQLLGKALTRKI